MITWWFFEFDYIIDYINAFSHMESHPTQSWDDAYLIMMNVHTGAFLDLIYENFIENFGIYIHK